MTDAVIYAERLQAGGTGAIGALHKPVATVFPQSRLTVKLLGDYLGDHTGINLSISLLTRYFFGKSGASRGTRTPDLVLTKDLLYQLSY